MTSLIFGFSTMILLRDYSPYFKGTSFKTRYKYGQIHFYYGVLFAIEVCFELVLCSACIFTIFEQPKNPLININRTNYAEKDRRFLS